MLCTRQTQYGTHQQTKEKTAGTVLRKCCLQKPDNLEKLMVLGQVYGKRPRSRSCWSDLIRKFTGLPTPKGMNTEERDTLKSLVHQLSSSTRASALDQRRTRWKKWGTLWKKVRSIVPLSIVIFKTRKFLLNV